MGKKGKAKTKAKKKAKQALKKKGVKKPTLKQASKLAKQSEKSGIDVDSLASSALSGIPFVGPLLGDVIEQTGAVSGLAGGQGVSGRGGVRGVQLVDSKLGNLGTISRKKALQVLMNRGKRPPRKSKPVFVQLPQGTTLQKVG